VRIVVFGGRNYRDRTALYAALDRVHRERVITLLIEGEAPGADTLAKEWAQDRGIPLEPYEADWGNVERPGAVIRRRRNGDLYDAAAGPARNQRMVDEGKPDGAVGFPGATGTADMTSRLNMAGVSIWWPCGKARS
jgi:YspA, cpYpsA-related SLOG family